MLNKVIISGGGTGGHIFPAIAIANEIKRRYPNCEILFVGAQNKMEMEKVPEAGYEIIGLPIIGIQRKLRVSNLWVPIKFLKSIWIAKRIIKNFKPDKVVGVGGFASSALIYAASTQKIPILIQEQNSYAGLTNKWMANKSSRICVAYEGMEKFFPKDKIVITGNPVRESIHEAVHNKKSDSKIKLGFDDSMPLVLVIGGSLGARSINNSLQHAIRVLHANGIQVLWQTGKMFNPDTYGLRGVQAHTFINDMATAYSGADIVVSRAGAISVSEICLLNKPSILVPLPTAAEDHQTKNASALSDSDAAILVKDSDASEQILHEITRLISSPELQNKMQANLKRFAKPDALKSIVDELDNM